MPPKPLRKPAPPAAPTAFSLRAALRKLASPEQAVVTAGFFKTGPGEYAEGDQFIGIKVPVIRKEIKAFSRMPMTEIKALLHSKIHEERLAALLILVSRFETGGPKARKEIYDFYMAELKWINNWDLVDVSAPQIVGAWLQGQDRMVLREMAKSKRLWDRRIAMVSTHHFVKLGESGETFVLAAMLLKDENEHELIHKAAGWMLREVGKHVGENTLRGFLKEHASNMPRVALRYAIEHFDKKEKARWLEA